MPAGRRGRQRGRQPTGSRGLKPAVWRQSLHEGFSVCTAVGPSSAFQWLWFSVLLGNGQAFLPIPLATALVTDPSMNTCIHASCGYLSAVIAKVRDCFTVSSCVSTPKREGIVVWTLMSVLSVTQCSDLTDGKKWSVLWDNLSDGVILLLSCTKLLLFKLFFVRPSSLVFMG